MVGRLLGCAISSGPSSENYISKSYKDDGCETNSDTHTTYFFKDKHKSINDKFIG